MTGDAGSPAGRHAGPRRIAILGATGSIGTQALDVVRRNRERFEVVALSTRSRIDDLANQAIEFGVGLAVVAGSGDDAAGAERLRGLLAARGVSTEVLAGQEGLIAAASDPGSDTVLNGVVGAAGLRSTLAALRAGKRLALANKESLVAGGDLVLDALSAGGGELLPVDSEHAGLAQCLRAGAPSEVARMIITASGGPFRGRTLAELESVSVEDALKHPTWEMGRKITIDSATLMNKGLESIEAHVLFGIGYDRIDVVVHPQSVVHAMVEFVDGSTIAQLAEPDMEGPIGFALGAPERLDDPVGTIDWSEARSLTFERPDRDAFRCLDLAFEAGRAGGVLPAVMNAANEEAVEGFLSGRIGFLSIPAVIETTMNDFEPVSVRSADDLFSVEGEARQRARAVVGNLSQT